MDFVDDITCLKGVGGRKADNLKRLGIENIKDLVNYFPRDYESLLTPGKISHIVPGDKCVIRAKILSIANKKTFRRRFSITTALLEDKSGSLEAVWFNQPYTANILHGGNSYIFYGRTKRNNKTDILQLVSPRFEKQATIVPIYKETTGVSSKYLQSLVAQAISGIGIINDPVSHDILQQHNLITLNEALRSVHLPSTINILERARQRIAFNELLVTFARYIMFERNLTKHYAPFIQFDLESTRKIINTLPFDLTGSQRLAAWRILQVMTKTEGHKKRTRPLNALVNGDVGSGKTIVALLATISVIKAGYNVVWLAPTAVLANQHFDTVNAMTSKLNIKVEAVTAATRDRKNSGHNKPTIIIGTHALLHRKKNLGRIGLLIIDEQHRFGVEQRRQLLAETKGVVPHFLSLSATPIPRSLAMLLGGMVDLITMKDMPRARKSIETRIVSSQNQADVYKIIEREIASGRQAFIIVPLIESSGAGNELQSLDDEYANLQKSILGKRRIVRLHGRVKEENKQRIMKQVSERKFDILLSTSVVEVGVDVPNATVILIKNADHFGLAQLHQFRGRVGRSNYQSYCFLMSDNSTDRLQVLAQTDNGFEIAQRDLELRGPGSFAGLDQSGFVTLKIASLFDDKLMESARKVALSMYNDGKGARLERIIEEL